MGLFIIGNVVNNMPTDTYRIEGRSIIVPLKSERDKYKFRHKELYDAILEYHVTPYPRVCFLNIYYKYWIVNKTTKASCLIFDFTKKSDYKILESGICSKDL